MNCRVCGRQFDPRGFQVMVPGIRDAFDRVDCALEASALGPPPAAARSVPLALDLSAAPEAKPQPESAVAGGGSQAGTAAAPVPVAATQESGGGRLASNRSQSKPRPARRSGGPALRPSLPPPPPAEPAPARSAPVPTVPVPSAPPDDRVPGPMLPGGGSSPAQPTLFGGGGTRPGSG